MRYLTLVFAMLVAGCASIETYRTLDQPVGQQLTTSVGGTIFRLNRSSDLPNAFGRADLYGGKVDRGFAELKFLGLNNEGKLRLWVADVNASSSETTMDRYRPGIQVETNVVVSSGSTDSGVEFTFDPTVQRDLVIAGVRVVFLDIQPYSVIYRIENTQ